MVWALPLILGCLGFAGLGWYEMRQSDEKHKLRLSSITEYNTSVIAWREHYPAFEALSMSISHLHTDDVTVNLPQDGTAEKFSDTSTDYLSYTPLKYHYKGPLASDGMEWEEVTMGGVKFESIEGVPETVELSKSTTMALANWKQCHYGRKGAYQVRGEHTCTVYSRLRSVCMLVEMRGGKWLYAGGCHDSGNWLAYEVVSCARDSPPRMLSLSSVDITIRSAEDPYLVARRVTSGKLFFGETKSESQRSATILLIVSGSFAVLFIGILCLQHGTFFKQNVGYRPMVSEKPSEGKHISIDVKM